MKYETWYKIWCEKCDTPNWFESNDYSIGFECYKCGHKWRDEIDNMINLISIDKIECEIGLEKPE